MTIEHSHGKPRLTRPRLTALSSVGTDGDRLRRDHDVRGRFRPGNRASGDRTAKQTIDSRERAALAQELAKAAGVAQVPSERANLLRDVLRLYRATVRDLASDGPVVRASALAFAREAVFASLLSDRAAELGVTTQAGLAMLEAAQKAEARAERASVHATVMAAKFATGTKGKTIDATPWLDDDEPKGAA